MSDNLTFLTILFPRYASRLWLYKYTSKESTVSGARAVLLRFFTLARLTVCRALELLLKCQGFVTALSRFSEPPIIVQIILSVCLQTNVPTTVPTC